MMSDRLVLNASEHPVKAVTIFQSSTAELTRTFKAAVQSGRNVIELTGLSSKIDVESPRVHNLTGGSVRVFDVCCDMATAASLAKRNLSMPSSQSAELIEMLSQQKKALAAEKRLRQEEYDTLEDTARSLLTKEAVGDFDSVMDKVMQRKRSAIQAVHEYDRQIAAIEREIALVGVKRKGETAAVVITTLIAEGDCEIEFELTYLVSNVSWEPYYDLRATTSDGQPSPDISLHYCANITQTTGEDWGDVILTLSTANSQTLHSLSIPQLDSLKISPEHDGPGMVHVYRDYERPAHRAHRAHRSVSPDYEPRARRRMSVGRYRSNSPPYRRSPSPAPITAPVVEGNPLSLAYRVNTAVSLPSDGLAHRVSIAVLSFTAELKFVCVPRQLNAAFIEGNIENTSQYELLAGPVSVFMDNGFVTKTYVGLITLNESFNCVLGVATALKVTYNQDSRTEQEPQRNFSEPTKTTTRTVRTAITNNHTFDVRTLVVRDAIPVGDDDAKIKVTLRKPAGLAEAKEDEEVSVDITGDVKDAKVHWAKVENGKGGEKDGMYEWVCAIPAGKKAELLAEWDIKAPSNVSWEEKAKE